MATNDGGHLVSQVSHRAGPSQVNSEGHHDFASPSGGRRGQSHASMKSHLSKTGSSFYGRVGNFSQRVQSGIMETHLHPPEVEEHLPLTGHRHATMWDCTYHNITAMLGAGVLGLPSAVAACGWIGGTILLVLSLFISWYTFALLVYMHEVPDPAHGFGAPQLQQELEATRAHDDPLSDVEVNVPSTSAKEHASDAGSVDPATVAVSLHNGKEPIRFNRYRDLSCFVLGPKLGTWVLVPFQAMLCYGISVTYTVTGGSSMKSFANGTGNTDTKLSEFIAIFGAIQVVLAQLPSIESLWWVSLLGAAVAFGYTFIAIVVSCTQALPGDVVNYKEGSNFDTDTSQGMLDYVMSVFNALTTVLFAYGGHNIALEIQGTLPSPPSTVGRMMKSVHIAFVATGVVYFSVAFTGFAGFGTAVASNVLESLPDAEGAVKQAILAADILVVVHVIAAFQLYSMIIHDMIEEKIMQWIKRPLGWKDRIISRTLYVCSTTFMAALIPFFGDLMGLIGAIGVTPTTFVLPSVLWLCYKRPRWTSWEFWLNWAIALSCGTVGVLGAIASIYLIVQHASTYEIFS